VPRNKAGSKCSLAGVGSLLLDFDPRSWVGVGVVVLEEEEAAEIVLVVGEGEELLPRTGVGETTAFVAPRLGVDVVVVVEEVAEEAVERLVVGEEERGGVAVGLALLLCWLLMEGEDLALDCALVVVVDVVGVVFDDLGVEEVTVMVGVEDLAVVEPRGGVVTGFEEGEVDEVLATDPPELEVAALLP
jgi:hypothetical protein